jgi:hypothetical protein
LIIRALAFFAFGERRKASNFLKLSPREHGPPEFRKMGRNFFGIQFPH